MTQTRKKNQHTNKSLYFYLPFGGAYAAGAGAYGAGAGA